MKEAMKLWAKAMRVASKRLPILPDKKLNESLQWAAGDLAEAYRIGAEEAQGEILSRLQALEPRAATQGETK